MMRQRFYSNAPWQSKRPLAVTLGARSGAWRNLYATQGRYADAAPLYERILEIADKTGSSHPLVAAALHDLASVYVNQKRYADAESLYKRAIAIRQISFGLEHPWTSELNLAGLYALQGRIADALPLIRHIATLSRNDIRPAKW